MSLTVLSVAYPLANVGPDAVGGAEQVLSNLDRALVAGGHRSIVIAPEGSQVAGTSMAIPAVPASIDDEARNVAHAAVREAIRQASAQFAPDVIHLHGIDFDAYLPAPSLPVLVTLHLPLEWYAPDALTPTRSNTFLHCVSETQHRSAPSGVQLLPPVPNGIDLDTFRPRGRTRDFAMLLGRICPEKGVDIALRACRAASIPLLTGGRVYPYPAHEEYFANQVAPLLDRCRRFLGPLDLHRKAALLAAAKCLLIPSTAPETSSLVAMEALACGTPVIAFDSGALPEIVEDGQTGFIVEDEAGLIAAMKRVDQISPERCRKAAESRFGLDRTIEAYFARYGALAHCGSPGKDVVWSHEQSE